MSRVEHSLLSNQLRISEAAEPDLTIILWPTVVSMARNSRWQLSTLFVYKWSEVDKIQHNVDRNFYLPDMLAKLNLQIENCHLVNKRYQRLKLICLTPRIWYASHLDHYSGTCTPCLC